ncbi:MAG TPA: 1-deoxy-D-xylulose-5-phosphate reductoisomerase [candidate division Zixibacteria bacterium]|nr:1-deoxy-D-xylulose-5-phosphate reductoisomerase [candidate division Zixibacteria bacterium]
MRTLALLGSTGSIGVSALDLVRRFPDRFRVCGLVAGKNLRRLAAQIREFSPRYVSIRDEEDVPRLRAMIGRRRPEILWGERGAIEVATAAEVDVVLAAIVGGAGLMPTLQAVRAGKEIALANKEALVMAGEIFVKTAAKKKVRLLPVDSEHSAIFQCLQGNRREEVDKLILTASGGPFLKTPLGELRRVTVAQALRHPNWKMGRKITIDSATMMNKGLEVIEAHWEFDMEPARIDVVIHPQSVVHSMVRYQDGSVIAQLGVPDMRIPIAYALAYPHRLRGNWKPLELTRHGELNFLPVERKRYPALALAYEALREGGTMPAVLNAANEVAVEAFLAGRIRFLEIHRIIERTMQQHVRRHPRDIEEILDVDRWARERAAALAR